MLHRIAAKRETGIFVNQLTPREFQLGQNHPNPFNERTTIKFCVRDRCRVILTIHDSTGAPVDRLVDEVKLPGTYEIVYEPTHLPPDTYLCRMRALDFTATKTILLKRQS